MASNSSTSSACRTILAALSLTLASPPDPATAQSLPTSPTAPAPAAAVVPAPPASVGPSAPPTPAAPRHDAHPSTGPVPHQDAAAASVPPRAAESAAPHDPRPSEKPIVLPTPGPQSTVSASPDGTTAVTLGGAGVNRVLFPSTLTSAHTNSDAVDVELRERTAIVTFRTPEPADVLFFTTSGQYLLRLSPADLPSQTVKLSPQADVPATSSSYQSQLAGLIEGAYRRDTPTGYRLERPGTPLAIDGALLWWVALRYRGHTFTIEEYAVYNNGAVERPLMDPDAIARRFSPGTRAISADPPVLPPGQWSRVIAVFPSEAAATPPTIGAAAAQGAVR